ELSTVPGKEMRPLFRELLLWVYERHQETSILEDVITHMENVLRGETPARGRVRAQAIAFLDLSGFTRLTEERGDEAAAELAATLADLVQDASLPHGGRPAELLGGRGDVPLPGPRARRRVRARAGRTGPRGGAPAGPRRRERGAGGGPRRRLLR